MASASNNTIVGFDEPSAQRIGKTVRRVEGMPIEPGPSQNKQAYSIEQIVVPRSGPDGNGLYTCDIYIVDNPTSGTYTQVATGVKARLLPTSL